MFPCHLLSLLLYVFPLQDQLQEECFIAITVFWFSFFAGAVAVAALLQGFATSDS